MEASKNYRDEILRRVEYMPEEQLAKVISLLNKLDSETAAPKYSEAIKNIWGSLTDSNSSSAAFGARKAEEKRIER